MRIQNNITAVNSHRQYNINNRNIGKNMEKLSSGFRVNRAADDAAGLAISEKMRAQIRGLNQASRNSQDAISLVQTAEGGMQTIQDILQRIRELAIQAASDTNQDEVDREALDLEVGELLGEIDQIAETTEFNRMALLDGRFNPDHVASGGTLPDGVLADDLRNLFIQAGANHGQTMTITIRSMTMQGLGLEGAGVNSDDDPITGGEDRVSVHSREAASYAIDRIDSALNCVSMMRAELGAFQNRLEFKIQNLDNQAENVAAAESRIRDADMAKLMTEFTKNNILFQASTAMLAQANALPQGVLQLLG
ncbi:MAG: flagellin [Oscillospiraceae bacterium]|nr:flagellin [Oscillospiraceae bacterium]